MNHLWVATVPRARPRQRTCCESNLVGSATITRAEAEAVAVVWKRAPGLIDVGDPFP